VSSLVSGPWAVALVLIIALGLPLQLALGALIALRRPLLALPVLAVPALLLLAGLGGTIAAFEDAMAAVWHASDPAWAPWFALQDRAHALAYAGIAGLGSAALALPVALGAAVTSMRMKAPPGARYRVHVVVGLGLPTVLGFGVAGLAAAWLVDSGAPLALVGVGGTVFLAAALVTAVPSGARHLPALTMGVGALGLGVAGLVIAAATWGGAGTADALGDYSEPFSAMPIVVGATRTAWKVGWMAAAFGAVLVLPAGLAAVARSWRRVDPAHGLDAMGVAILASFVLLTAGWTGARARVLTVLAGAHAAEVLRHAPGYDVPVRAPIPPRVLVGEAATPRWIMMRDRGGVERVPIAGGLEIVGPAILRGDGLMLPPKLPLEDLYLALFESGAGSVSVVGCATAPPVLLQDIERDPLLAVGRCAAFPMELRVTERLEHPRVLIVLKDKYVDDHGDVVPLAEVKDIEGRDVIVRGQLDATVADLVAMLQMLPNAGRVYLGHGVTVEGDDLPIGVDPGLRVTRLPSERGDAGGRGADEGAGPPGAETPEASSTGLGEG
jgi:hypothetical protein